MKHHSTQLPRTVCPAEFPRRHHLSSDYNNNNNNNSTSVCSFVTAQNSLDAVWCQAPKMAAPAPQTTTSSSTTRLTRPPSSTYKPFTLVSFPANPLTTTFTPTPTDCSGLYIPTDLMLYMIHDQTSCLPSGFATAERSFFSPGVVCPSGYWSACHDNNGASSITTVTCCPTYVFDISMSCVNPATLAGRFQNLFCTWTAGSRNTRVLAVTESLTGRTSTVDQPFTGEQGLNAYGVRMVYQATDMKLLSSSSTAQTSSFNSNSNSTTAESSSNGITTAAVVAIGILVPLAIISLSLGVFFLWRKRRRQRQEEIANSQERKTNPYFYGGPPLLYRPDPGPDVSEMATRGNVPELSGATGPVELPVPVPVQIHVEHQTPEPEPGPEPGPGPGPGLPREPRPHYQDYRVNNDDSNRQLST